MTYRPARCDFFLAKDAAFLFGPYAVGDTFNGIWEVRRHLASLSLAFQRRWCHRPAPTPGEELSLDELTYALKNDAQANGSDSEAEPDHG